jgi:hypothetical protein
METNDSNYGSESNLDSCSSTLHFTRINHISNINFDQNAFLHDPHSHTAYSNSTGVNFDFNSSNSHQSFSTTKTFSTFTDVNLSSLAHISNNELQFNAVNNYSMNLSPFQPQIDSEDEDEVEDNVVKEVVETKKVEAKKRGRPPLTEDQKEKNAAKKATTKAAKRAKKD